MDLLINNKKYIYQKYLNSGGYGKSFLYRYNQNYYVIKFFYPFLNHNNYSNFKHEMIIEESLIEQMNYICDKSYLCYIESFYITPKEQPLYDNIYINMKTNRQLFRSNIYAIITLYVEGDDLYDYLKKVKKGTYNDDINFCNFMIHIIDLFHPKNIFHRDIKLENIIRKINGEYVLIDFGLSCINICDDLEGTLEYYPPWNMNKKVLTKTELKENDIFSFMVTLYFLSNGTYPFNKTKTILYDSYKLSNSGYINLDNFINIIFSNKKFEINYIKNLYYKLFK